MPSIVTRMTWRAACAPCRLRASSDAAASRAITNAIRESRIMTAATLTHADTIPANGPILRLFGSRLLRSSPRPVHAVLHRDVGALELLRNAGAAAALHARAGDGRRPGLRHGAGRGDLRAV